MCDRLKKGRNDMCDGVIDLDSKAFKYFPVCNSPLINSINVIQCHKAFTEDKQDMLDIPGEPTIILCPEGLC